MKQQSEQTAASNSAVRDREKLVDLMGNLESALAAASFNRIENWNDLVQDQFSVLQSALMESRLEFNSNSGLFAEISEESPRLIPRIEKLKQKFQDLERQIITLRNQFQESSPSVAVSEVREQLSLLLKSLRQAQAEENELVFEAIGRDLGGGG